jgi:hypothetical protein
VLPLAIKLKECGVFGIVGNEFLAQARKNRKMWELHGEELGQSMLERAKSKAQPVKESLSVVLQALVEIREMRSLFASKIIELSTKAMDKVSPGDAKRTSKLVEEVESITRVVNRFEQKMEKGLQSLIEIAGKKKGDQDDGKELVTKALVSSKDFYSFFADKGDKRKTYMCEDREEIRKRSMDLMDRVLDTVLTEKGLLIQ